jgi:hypothetical protein
LFFNRLINRPDIGSGRHNAQSAFQTDDMR